MVIKQYVYKFSP